MRRDDTRSPVGLRAGAVAIVALGFAAILGVAALQGVPEFGAFPLSEQTVPPAGETQSPMPMESAPAQAETEVSPWVGVIAAVIGSAVVLVLAFLVIRLIVRVLLAWWRDRPLARVEATAPDAGIEAIPSEEEAVQAPVVRRGIAGALDAVDARPDPSDAIVAAWLGLEDGAESAGLRRGVAETPAEFTVRIVGIRQPSARDVRALLSLYESVRFGGRVATESDRVEARGRLRAIEEEWR